MVPKKSIHVQEIILMRHGIAVDREDFAGSDADRPLTPSGAEKVHRVARALAGLYQPALIVTSDYLRARATAEICLAEFRPKRGRSTIPRIEIEVIRPHGSWNDWCSWFLEHERRGELGESILVVGHEPNLSVLLGGMLHADSDAFEFKKAGVAVLARSESNGWKLKAFLSPKVLLI